MRQPGNSHWRNERIGQPHGFRIPEQEVVDAAVLASSIALDHLSIELCTEVAPESCVEQSPKLLRIRRMLQPGPREVRTDEMLRLSVAAICDSPRFLGLGRLAHSSRSSSTR